MKRATKLALLQSELGLGPPPKKKRPKKDETPGPRREWPAGLRSLTVDPNSLDLPKNPKTKPPRMGLCWRLGEEIIAVASMGFERGLERWTFRLWRPGEEGHAVYAFDSDWLALRSAMRQVPGDEPDTFRVQALFYEVGMGNNTLSVKQQSDCRGYLRALSHEAGNELVMELHSSTWKKHARLHFGVKVMDKDVGLALARERLRVYLPDGETDAADAVMQSEAVPYMDVLPGE